MVKFIESELVSLKKEVNEMWTLVYNQLDRAGEAVLTFNRDQAQQVIVREKRVNAFELKIDSDVEDTIALYNPVAIDLRFVLAMFKIICWTKSMRLPLPSLQNIWKHTPIIS